MKLIKYAGWWQLHTEKDIYMGKFWWRPIIHWLRNKLYSQNSAVEKP